MKVKAPQFWYSSQSLISWFFIPFALLYRLITILLKTFYTFKFKNNKPFSVPIVVIGNVTVGGNGKTPLTIWLANQLKKKGFQPGLISRGYGGRTRNGFQVVTSNSNPRFVGDEAILLAKTNCPVVIGTDRLSAIAYLLRHFICNIVISDDGLQNYSLPRDIEIVVIDPDRKFGNGLCIPAGPLREPKSRIHLVDFLVTKKFRPVEIYQLKNPEKKIHFKKIKGKIIHAIAGLGNPESFFCQLELLGAKVIQHAFPDHYFYQRKDFQFSDDKIILMTEKDAVKCKDFNDERLFCLSVTLDVPKKFLRDFCQKLEKYFKNFSKI
ncbi:tetraacyldisaccharide 4'-kinase [Coxiella endosymbiont of Amblyomma americanum]|uniref:tetraacyldisaccharide 4'-kinase n=1 Tax=Coxiella endosymbiont of Amblyomma americanum TaxID=325775 RepID=UPI00057D78C5|nr:tetraacyldisaccharide 4'-kinase [Coxiella endosymbiont of Amblyomma americanum]AJC50553.1 tetraacyldisaccharide 4'-kinase [Coxiella endosymbiont of Amblyomma americanum]AUJ58887.1 tetraacyldisaccharide 4'-kinase [Coxiella-like endosymbiont of Amblyomma americanum]